MSDRNTEQQIANCKMKLQIGLEPARLTFMHANAASDDRRIRNGVEDSGILVVLLQMP